jgi:hypothetical protein
MSNIRESVNDLSLLNSMTDNEVLDDAKAYFDRRKDHDFVKSAIQVRYGIGIKKETDPNNKDASIETYVKQDFNIAINTGSIEALTIGFGQKIVNALSTLFTEEGHSMTLVHDSIDSDGLEEVDQLLETNRTDGGFDTAIVEADEQSIQVGSGAILVGFNDGSLVYDSYIPSAVRFYFPELIIDGDTGKKRTPVTDDIEDCIAVVVRLSTVDLVQNNYLAILGRSTECPNGRFVQYQASSITTEIPDIGDDSIVSEYEIDGGVANPLSVMANQFPDEPVPEYPISIIKGVVSSKTTPMPTSTSLYEDCLEFDVATSHSLSGSQKAATGCDVLSLDEKGQGRPLPRTLDGAIVTQAGQTLEHVSKDAGDADTSFNTTKKMMVECASGWTVPDYMVSSEDHTVDAASGIALEVKTRPLIKGRNKRIRKNTEAVNRLFNIEKYLLFAHSEGDDSVLNTLLECSQVWNAGEIRLPEDRTKMVERLGAAMEKGLIDQVEAIRDYYALPTEAEAVELYEKLKERSEQYPPLEITKKEVPRATNVGSRFRGQPQQQ